MSTVADVNHIYNVVNGIINKEQKGYVKVDEFNTLLQQAELENLKENYYKSRKERGVESDNERRDAIAPYLKKLTGSSSTVNLATAAPDFLHLISVMSGNSEVKNVRHSELYSILQSSIVQPTQNNPIYVISPTSTGATPNPSISFYNSTTGPNSMSYSIIYLKSPNVPASGHYVINTTSGLFNAAESTALDAPKSEHVKITKIILKYLGLHLRENDIFNYSSGELQND